MQTAAGKAQAKKRAEDETTPLLRKRSLQEVVTEAEANEAPEKGSIFHVVKKFIKHDAVTYGTTLLAAAISLGVSVVLTFSPGFFFVSDWSLELTPWRNFFFVFGLLLCACPAFIIGVSYILAQAASSYKVIRLITPQDGNSLKRKFRNRVAGVILRNQAQAGGEWDIDGQLVHVLLDEIGGSSSIVWYFALAVLAASISGLTWSLHSAALHNIMTHIFFAFMTYRTVVVLCKGSEIIVSSYEESAGLVTSDKLLHQIKRGIKVLLRLFGLLFMLNNYDCNVSSILTGLGMAGMLMGLLAQAVFKDIFAWGVISYTKPFQHGELIQVGGAAPAEVTKIGFQQTRLHAPGGETQVYSNDDLLHHPITNLSHIRTRRLSLSWQISVCTRAADLAKVPELAQKAVEAQAHCEFVRCFLSSVVEYGFQYDLLFMVTNEDYNQVCAANTEIWVRLLGFFEEKGLNLAGADRMTKAKYTGTK